MISYFISAILSALIITWLFRSKKCFSCPRCGERFERIPNRAMGITYLLLAVVMIVTGIVNGRNYPSVFDYLVGSSGIYYLLKKEKRSCIKCKKEIY